jgi:hypothetical protein
MVPLLKGGGSESRRDVRVIPPQRRRIGMDAHALHVAVDVGARRYRAAIGNGQGGVLAEFDVEHSGVGFKEFFRRVEEQRQAQQPV